MENPPTTASENLSTRSGRTTRKYRILPILLVIFCALSGLAIWKFAPELRNRWTSKNARAQALLAVAQIEAGEIELGYIQLLQAFRHSPEDPVILRQMAAFYDRLPEGPAQAILFRRTLVKTGTADWEDLTALAQGLLRQDNVEEAAQLLKSLPGEVSHEIQVVELRAALMARMDRPVDAEHLLREAWEARPDDAPSRIKLAGLNARSPFKEISAAAGETLWQAARNKDEHASLALLALRDSGLVTEASCEELLTLAEHAEKISEFDFYALLDTCISVSPSMLTQSVAAARAKLKKNSQSANKDYFYQWLARHSTPDTILKEVSLSEALLSRQLLLAYGDALIRSRRFKELDDILTLPKAPLSHVDVSLLRAYIAQGRGEPQDSVRTHVRTAEMRAGLAHDYRGLNQVAAEAEHFGFPDIAIDAHTKLAANRSTRLESLKRIFHLRHEGRDTRGMLNAAEELIATRPGLPPYADEVVYLKLIHGTGLENAINTLQSETQSHGELSPLQRLSLALAASHTGDLKTLKSVLPQIPPASLETGPRAVLSGLLQIVGESHEAIALAQSVSSQQLLPEEQWYRRIALQ